MDNPFKNIYDICNRVKETASSPWLVDIELTNTCNLKCKMCPTGMGTCKRPKGFMSGNVFHKILRESDVIAIRFVRWGEPTLHPRLYDWIAEARDRGIITHINTNGILLDVEEVLGCGLHSIKFSFQGFDSEEYTKYRGKGFYALINKIPPLYNSNNRPFITIGTTVEKHDSLKYDKFLKWASGMSDKIVVGKTRDLTEPAKEYKPCPEVFCKLSIDWDGKVTACCGDYDRLMTIGDVKENTLKEIWNCEKMNYYRQMLADFRHAELPLCRCCGV